MKRLIAVFIIIGVLSAYSRKELTWVAIGDSITYLNNHPAEAANKITKGYMTRVVEKLPNLHYINKGYNGWTSGGIAEHFDTLGIIKADIYSVFLGTNDWFSGRPLGTFSDYLDNTGNNTVNGSFRIIVNKLRALNKDARIIFITPMQRTDFVYQFNMKNNAFGSYRKKNNQSLEEFVDAIVKIADHEHFTLVNLYNKKELSIENLVKFKRLKDSATGQYKDYTYPEYTRIPFDPVNDAYPYPPESIDMTYDGLHPSDKGYEVISDMLIDVLK